MLGNPLQVAVNWITKKLYWCDSTLSTIEYSDYNGDNRKVLLSNVDGVAAVLVLMKFTGLVKIILLVFLR